YDVFSCILTASLSFNLSSNPETYTLSLHDALPIFDNPNPPAVYSGAISIAENIPGFAAQNRCEIAGNTAVARIWMGNAEIVSTQDRKSTRLNSSHVKISYAVFCLIKKNLLNNKFFA